MVERQRDDLEAPLDDISDELDSSQGEIFDDNDRTYSVVSGGRPVKSASVPTFVAETIHGPQGNTLQAIEIVTRCLNMDMVIESGSETQILTAYVKEGDTETTDWMENIVTIIVL